MRAVFLLVGITLAGLVPALARGEAREDPEKYTERRRISWMNDVKGVRPADAVLEVTPGTEKQSSGLICFVFPEWVVVEATSSMFTDSLRLHRRVAGRTAERSCREPGKNDFVIKSGFEVLGMVGQVLVLDLASDYTVAFHDIVTGKKLLEDDYNPTSPVTVTEQSGRPTSVDYMRRLKLHCLPSSAACWRETLERSHVQPTVNLPPPVCPSDETDVRGLVVYVPVSVPDIHHPKLVYKSGTPECDAVP